MHTIKSLNIPRLTEKVMVFGELRNASTASQMYWIFTYIFIPSPPKSQVFPFRDNSSGSLNSKALNGFKHKSRPNAQPVNVPTPGCVKLYAQHEINRITDK